MFIVIPIPRSSQSGPAYRGSYPSASWRQHRCAQCGTLFRYFQEKTCVGEGATEQEARTKLDANVRRHLDPQSGEGIEPWPCPTCGSFQPDMDVRKWERPKLIVRMIFTVLSCLLLVVIAAAVWEGALWVLMIYGALLAVTFLRRRPTGKDAAQGLAEAQSAVGLGKLAVDERGMPPPAVGAIRRRREWGWVTVVLLVLAVLLFPLAAVLHKAAAWPTNDGFVPALVAPGDAPAFAGNGQETIRSLKGYWRSSGSSVEVQNPADLPAGVAQKFKLIIKDDPWTDPIRYKKSDASDLSLPALRVQVPNAPELVGKKIVLHGRMTVEYPKLKTDTEYSVERTELDQTASLVCISLADRTAYFSAFWLSTLGGIGILIGLPFAAWVRLEKARRQRTLVQIIPVQAAPTQTPPPVPPPLPPMPPPLPKMS